MAIDIGPRIGIDGEAQFRKELETINQKCKTLASEMKAVTTQFSGNEKSQEALTAKARVLSQQIVTQTSKIAELKQGLIQATAKFGDADARTLKWKQAVNEATAQLNTMKSDLGKSDRAVDELNDTMEEGSEQALSFGDVLKANLASDAIVAGVKKVAGVIKDLFMDAFDYNKGMENAKTDFKVMLGDAEKAEQLVSSLKGISSKTPFELTDLTSATKTLLAFNVTAEDSTGVLTQLGDISLGNANKLETLSRAYGKMNSSGKVTLESINMMIDAGFNPLNNVSESTGETMEALYDRISKGTMSFDEIKGAIADATSEGGQFYKGMEEASKTTDGLISTLKDNINEKLGAAFQGLTDKIRDEVLPKAIEFVNSLDTQKISDAITGLIDKIQQFIPVIVGATTAIVSYKAAMAISGLMEKLKSATQAQTAAQALLNAVTSANPFVLLASLVAAVITALVTLYLTNDEFREKVNAAWTAIKETIGNCVSAVVEFFTVTIPGAFNAVIDFVKTNWQGLLLLLVNPFVGAFKLLYDNCEGFRNTVNNLVEKVKSAFENMRVAIASLASRIGTAIMDGIGKAVDWIKSLPQQAITWGKDLINGFIDGIKSMISKVTDTARNVAKAVADFLHFSVPEKGPLADADEYGPDFMRLFADGIKKNIGLVADASRRAASQMVLPPKYAAAGAGIAQSTFNAGGITLMIDAPNVQNVNQLADVVMEKLSTEIGKRGGVWRG